MGRCVLELAAADERFELRAALVAVDDPRRGSRMAVGDRQVTLSAELDGACDVLIDFTSPAGTMAWLEVCQRRRIPMVMGVTGLDGDQAARIRRAGQQIPILCSANFSLGINSILGFLGRLARDLGDEYDIEIVEAHHRRKVDAPSGTALTLAREIATALGRSVENDAIYGRQGQVGPRPKGQIAIHAVRMGDLVSEHEVHFSGPGETVTIRHTAHSRATYAAGALRAARWLVRAGPGYYTMRDVFAPG
jgi:4-hydroxy-tetrahydrodipicolinate reductase